MAPPVLFADVASEENAYEPWIAPGPVQDCCRAFLGGAVGPWRIPQHPVFVGAPDGIMSALPRRTRREELLQRQWIDADLEEHS